MSFWPFRRSTKKKKRQVEQPLQELVEEVQEKSDNVIAKELIKSIMAKKKEKIKSTLKQIKNDKQLKRVLLEQKVERAYRRNINNSPLSYACETSTKDICDYLFSFIHKDYDSWFTEMDVNSVTAIHCAAINPSDDILRLLSLRNEKLFKENINIQDSIENTPLHYACFYEREKCVKWLLKKGSEFDCMNTNGELPLHWAAMGGDKDTFDAIFNIYIEKDLETRKEKLHLAGHSPVPENEETVENGDRKLSEQEIQDKIKEQLEKEGKKLGEDALNIEAKDLGVPLLYAAKGLKFDCMESIFNHQKVPDATVRDTECDTALHFVCNNATDEKLLEIIKSNGYYQKKLKEAKLLYPQNDYERNTEKIRELEKEASQEYYTEKLAKILKANALLGTKNEAGNCPLDWISHDVMKKLLDRHIYKVELQSHKGDTSKKDKYKMVISNFFGRQGSDIKNILALANSPKHEDLALHPFCQSIVSVKWKKMEKYFFLKLLFFIPLVVMLSVYSVLLTESKAYIKNGTDGEPNVFGMNTETVWYSLYTLLIIQVLCGIFSVLVLIGPFLKESTAYTTSFSKKRVMRLLEFYYSELLWSDWHEYLLWILTFLVLHSLISPIFVVIMSWFSLFRVFSNHPGILPFRYILFKILIKYIKFFIFAFGLITGFGMGFYLLLHGCKSDGKSCVEGAFDDVSGMALKIPSMMMGEISYDQFPFHHAFPYVYILFAGFIFLITCCLFNMMNGLAINITENLMEKSQIFKIIAQCQMIFEFEVLLAEVSSWIKWFGCYKISILSPLWIEKIEFSPSSGKCITPDGYKLTTNIMYEAKNIGESTIAYYDNDDSEDEDSEANDDNNPLITVNNGDELITSINAGPMLSLASSRASSIDSLYVEDEVAEKTNFLPYK